MADKPKELTIYRGLSGSNTSTIGATSRREGYGVFGSSSPAISATYAGDSWNESQGLPVEGEVRRFTISPDKVQEFPVRISRDGRRSFDMFGFDDRARALGPGEVLVVRGVQDSGPGGSWRADPEALRSWGADTYAIGDGTPVLSESSLSIEEAIAEHRRLVAAGQLKGPEWLLGASEAKQAATFDAATKFRREFMGVGLSAEEGLLPTKRVDPFDRMLELFGGEEGAVTFGGGKPKELTSLYAEMLDAEEAMRKSQESVRWFNEALLAHKETGVYGFSLDSPEGEFQGERILREHKAAKDRLGAVTKALGGNVEVSRIPELNAMRAERAARSLPAGDIPDDIFDEPDKAEDVRETLRRIIAGDEQLESFHGIGAARAQRMLDGLEGATGDPVAPSESSRARAREFVAENPDVTPDFSSSGFRERVRQFRLARPDLFGGEEGAFTWDPRLTAKENAMSPWRRGLRQDLAARAGTASDRPYTQDPDWPEEATRPRWRPDTFGGIPVHRESIEQESIREAIEEGNNTRLLTAQEYMDVYGVQPPDSYMDLPYQEELPGGGYDLFDPEPSPRPPLYLEHEEWWESDDYPAGGPEYDPEPPHRPPGSEAAERYGPSGPEAHSWARTPSRVGRHDDPRRFDTSTWREGEVQEELMRMAAAQAGVDPGRAPPAALTPDPAIGLYAGEPQTPAMDSRARRYASLWRERAARDAPAPISMPVGPEAAAAQPQSRLEQQAPAPEAMSVRELERYRGRPLSRWEREKVELPPEQRSRSFFTRGEVSTPALYTRTPPPTPPRFPLMGPDTAEGTSRVGRVLSGASWAPQALLRQLILGELGGAGVGYALDPESTTPLQHTRDTEDVITSVLGLPQRSQMPIFSLAPDRIAAVEAVNGMVGFRPPPEVLRARTGDAAYPDWGAAAVTEEEVRLYEADRKRRGLPLPEGWLGHVRPRREAPREWEEAPEVDVGDGVTWRGERPRKTPKPTIEELGGPRRQPQGRWADVLN